MLRELVSSNLSHRVIAEGQTIANVAYGAVISPHPLRKGLQIEVTVPRQGKTTTADVDVW